MTSQENPADLWSRSGSVQGEEAMVERAQMVSRERKLAMRNRDKHHS